MLVKLVLVLGAVVAALISYRAFVAPEMVLASVGVVPENLDGRNEIRAQYGGFFLVVTGVMLASLFGALPERYGLLLLLVSVGGVMLGRIVSMALEGPGALGNYSPTLWAYLASDVVIVALALWALTKVSLD